jgi:hypothetical protein
MKITVEMDAEVPAFDRRHEPVTVGIAFPAGQVAPETGLSLRDSHDRRCPVQATILDRWSDGSIRWALIDFQADVSATGEATYTLTSGAEPACPPDAPLQVDAEDHAIVVRTGPATFHVARAGDSLLTDVEAEGRSVFDGRASRLLAADAHGSALTFAIDRATIERSGPVRAVIRTDGRLLSVQGRALLDVVARQSFHAGLGAVHVELSITNPEAARHSGGQWDLGDPGSVLLRHMTVRLVPRGSADPEIRCSPERSDPLAVVGGPLRLSQDSSGGEHWRHENHLNRSGHVPIAFRGYRLVGSQVRRDGLRATPVVSIGHGANQLTVAIQHFWENFPKAIAVDGDGISIGLWPEDHGDLHELQGGERKTHAFVFCVGPDTVSDSPLFWARSPLLAVADPSDYLAAGVWTPLRAGTQTARDDYQTLVNVAIDGPASFRHRREQIDEYGWRNFGDLYADHESVGSASLVSHYNNQYDAVAGFITRFLASGDRRWWTAADELARHVSDIDIYHTRKDKAAYNGGYFWHTDHHAAARTATHRAYSRQMGRGGGGPSAEHNYTTGLMLHYFLAGSERSREAVMELAEWVLDMDDGAKSKFRWIDGGDTGLASSTRSPDYHGPGRGAGNSINALLDGHRLSHDRRYLDKANQLVRRCIHPSMSPEALDLLDAENRWSYTVFLQALGKYLEYRAELGLVEASDRYARAALLTFAGWMAEHERPYLEHPERLEFPTETWAAQDLRKAAVFEFAACHAADEREQARYRQRADDFMNYSVSTLRHMPSGTLTRPIVLLLAYGFQRPVLALPAATALDTARLPPPGKFVPIKQRVLRKLRVVAGLSAAALMLLVLTVTRRWVSG